jgi:hypothetical protein
MADAYTAWYTAYSKISGPHTPVDTEAKSRIAAAPQTGDDLPHSVFTRRKRHRFDFDGNSGKTVYFCLRYENGKGGEEGESPFGPILRAVIP